MLQKKNNKRKNELGFFTCKGTVIARGKGNPGIRCQAPGKLLERNNRDISDMFTWWLAVVFTNQLTHKFSFLMFSFVTGSQEAGRSVLARLRIGSKLQHRGKADVFKARWFCKIRRRAMSGKRSLLLPNVYWFPILTALSNGSQSCLLSSNCVSGFIWDDVFFKHLLYHQSCHLCRVLLELGGCWLPQMERRL